VTATDQIFREFVAAFRADATTDPREYLARAEGLDRAELRLRIEAFLEQAPRREWDPQAYEGSLAQRAIDAAERADEGWPELLPALRERARLKRATVVERLAAALGFAGSEERVGVYYHRMERGQLAPSGVSTRVLEALGSILGASVERLRQAGAAGEVAGAGGGEVFARLGAPREEMASPGILAAEDRAKLPAEPDELDLLFMGGD
jgi:hypothetical protein